MPDIAPDSDDIIVVGIGASAGGLEALQLLVRNLPEQSNFAYVIAQHLSPTHKSMMVNLLANETGNKVLEAKNNQKLERDVVYICPPNKNITVENEKIYLTRPDATTYSPKPNINIMFESIALSKGRRAIGIILSGTGSDGARGVGAIKAEGGFTFCQDPSTAKYDGMPNAAIATGNIDFIVEAETIGQELVDFVTYPQRARIQDEVLSEDGIYKRIIQYLLAETKVDFSHYKSTTIKRRIERRMAALKITNLSKYNNYLQKTPNESALLLNDILIGVTSFFRDTDAFDALQTVLSERIQAKQARSLRLWVAGCSTGEEAYSIGMMVADILGDDIHQWQIQIFATDIDEDSLNFARKGRYPESAVLSVLEHKIRKKYLRIESDQYLVAKPIRDMVIFSRHDITTDPPFMRLDLVSCRNVLIYFDAHLQRRALSAFHYSLRDSGILFLGKSESTGPHYGLFKETRKKWKIYRSQYSSEKSRAAPRDLTDFSAAAPRQPQQDVRRPPLRQILLDQIVQTVLPMCILVNDDADIIYVSGQNPFIVRPSGEATDNLYRNVVPALNAELRPGLQIALKEKRVVKTPFLRVGLPAGGTRIVRLIIAPITDDKAGETLTMICFQEEDEKDALYGAYVPGTATDAVVKTLEAELTRTRDQLQSAIEELETSNEELQSMNEELQSSNEELQSTNEELETTNEELQATNEELQTAYAELRHAYQDKLEKSADLEAARERLERSQSLMARVQDAAGIGLFEWDVASGIFECSDQVGMLLGLDDPKESLTTEELLDLIAAPERDRVRATLSASLKSGKLDTTFNVASGKSVRTLRQLGDVSYSSVDVPIKVLGTIQDVSELYRARNEVGAVQKRIQALLGDSAAGIYYFNLVTGRNMYINNKYTEITGYEFDDIDRMSPEQFMNLFHPDEMEMVSQHMQKVVNSEIGSLHGLVYRFRHKDGHWIWCHSQDVLLDRDDDGQAHTFLGAFMDVGQQMDRQGAGAASQDFPTKSRQLRELESGVGVAIVSTEGTPLVVNATLCSMLGYSAAELKAMKFTEFTHPEDVASDVDLYEELLKGKRNSYSLRKRYLRKSGDILPADLHVLAIRNSSGYISAIIGTVTRASDP